VEHGYRDLFNQLLSAIHEGNVEKIESFLEGNDAIDVNFCNLEGETALLFAAGYDRLDVVKLLIHHGANLNGSFINVNGATDAEERLEVDSEDHSDWTPLVKAIGHGYFEIAEHLIDCGADVTIKGPASPLHYATELCCSSESDDRKTGYLKIIHRLLDNGSHVDSQHTNSGQTVLSTACCQNDIEMARLFLDHGAAVDIGDKGRFSDEKTPLIHASRELSLDFIRLLLDHGANPNLADSKGNSPLHWACNLGYRDDYASAHLLLAYGADALAENLKGETCADWAAHGPALDRHSWPPILDLVKACQANKVERVEELVRSQYLPGQVKITVSEAPSTLEWSDFVAGTVKMIQAGMDGNVDVLHSYQKVGLHSTLQAPSQPGEFVLHFVSRLGLVQSVEVLFEKDADPNVKQHDGRTALSLAAEAGHAAVVECLLQNGADANLADRLFNTPLHYACREGQVDVIRSLVSKDGCTVSTRNWLNETAADLCQVEDILDLLSSLQQTN
jgi:ankyrin repeat protein